MSLQLSVEVCNGDFVVFSLFLSCPLGGQSYLFSTAQERCAVKSASDYW